MDFELKEYLLRRSFRTALSRLCDVLQVRTHLFCKDEHIPDDPTLPLPMPEMTIVTGYYAERFIDSKIVGLKDTGQPVGIF